MRPELRFALALLLMIGVFVVTSMLFPPLPPESAPAVEGVEPGAPPARADEPGEPPLELPGAAPDLSVQVTGGEFGRGEPERIVAVETPLYRIEFSNYGAVVRSVRLAGYQSFVRDGSVELVPDGSEILAGLWQYQSSGDPLDLTGYPHSVSPADGIRIGEGGGRETLTFRFDHPDGVFFSEIRYTFTADSYIVEVDGRLPAVDRAALFVRLGTGLAVNELKVDDDLRLMAVAGNHVDEGIESLPLGRIREPEAMGGPLRWAAVKSKFFVEVILPGTRAGGAEVLSGMWADPANLAERAAVRVGVPVNSTGSYSYRAYLGPVERDRLIAIGDDLEEVNPYGWGFLRPILRPLVVGVLWLVEALHEGLSLGYGWVLIVIGVLMRVVLWPLNRKSMRSQVKMMAIQPLAMDIKTRYKDDPQRMQQETIKLYKEHQVNPMAGCVPLLIPMPVFFALFFVFQNTIALRGVPFMWLPDLSAPDPLYLLPLFFGLTMFLTMKLTQTAAPNPQMKMMMYVMPIMMTVMFLWWGLPSGLLLYYSTVNVVTIPQQMLISNERKKLQAAHPVKRPA